MKTLILATLTLSLLNSAYAGTSMKVEGSCSGTFLDGSQVSYTYYSNYNGCKEISRAAVNFTSGIEGLFTGKRRFSNSHDIYSLDGYRLTFANSTGNTTGKLTYQDFETGKRRTIELQCEVRDYEYADC